MHACCIFVWLTYTCTYIQFDLPLVLYSLGYTSDYLVLEYKVIFKAFSRPMFCADSKSGECQM